MRILLTGATGALGRPTLEGLREAGHEVLAVVRSEATATWARERGARPVQIDLFDPAALVPALRGCDAVLHYATRIPEGRVSRRRFAETDALRRDASRRLVDASLEAGASCYVQESIAFVYADGSDAWLDESAPLGSSWLYESALDAERETARFAAAGGRGVALRFAAFYAPWAASTRRGAQLARRGLFPVPGSGEPYFSSIHVADAATASVAALGAPSGIYNVCDDEPVRVRSYVEAMTGAFGGPTPRRVPTWAARLALGEAARIPLTSRRVSNRRLREATGWRPAHPSVRTGWPEVARALA